MFINTKQIVYTISNTGFRNNNLSAHERKRMPVNDSRSFTG